MGKAAAHISMTDMFSLEGARLSNKAVRFFTHQYIAASGALFNRNMHVIRDPDNKLAYLPIPKAACSSLKFALLEDCAPALASDYHKQHLRRIHEYFARQPRMWMSEEDLRRFQGFRFTVVREPVDRFVSAYKNRIQHFEDLSDPAASRSSLEKAGLSATPDINEFALRLDAYRRANKSVDLHFRPQTDFIRAPKLFDAIHPLNQLTILVDKIERETGVRLNLSRANSSASERPALKPETLKKLIAYYSADYIMFPDFFAPPRI